MQVSSLKCGTLFWTDSISKDDWIGAKFLSMEVLLLLKKGLRRWENQAWKGNQVDGGG
jgi:hypothetical protein